MSKSLFFILICLPTVLINTASWADYPEQTADNENIASDVDKTDASQPDEYPNSVDAVLESMPDEELLMIAKRIYQSKKATAEMFNRLPPDKREKFSSRREVIDYIKASMAEKDLNGRF